MKIIAGQSGPNRTYIILPGYKPQVWVRNGDSVPWRDDSVGRTKSGTTINLTARQYIMRIA